MKEAQDAYCTAAQAGQWQGLGEFPTSLQWEMLVDVLRGRVKVNTHCYESVGECFVWNDARLARDSRLKDLDGLVRVGFFPIHATNPSEHVTIALERVQVPDRGIPSCARDISRA